MIDVGAEMRRAIGEIFSQRRFRVQPVGPTPAASTLTNLPIIHPLMTPVLAGTCMYQQ
jgi:hypothetical protein